MAIDSEELNDLWNEFIKFIKRKETVCYKTIYSAGHFFDVDTRKRIELIDGAEYYLEGFIDSFENPGTQLRLIKDFHLPPPDNQKSVNEDYEEETEEERELTGAETYALKFLKDGIDHLIENHKDYNINEEGLEGLSYSLEMINDYSQKADNQAFYIRSTREEDGEQVSYYVEFYENEISFKMEGYDDNDLGRDGYGDAYFVIGSGKEERDIIGLLDRWMEGFRNNLDKEPGLHIGEI